MPGIKTTRRQFGLSQQLLAAYLDVPRSLLSMAELNRRTLPAAALLKMQALQITAPAQTPPALPEAVQKEFSAQITFEIKELQYRATKLQRKLDTMQTRYAQAAEKKMLAAVLQVSHKTYNKDAAWQQLVEAEAKTAMKNNHAGMQALLQIKINCLQQEAAALSKLLQPGSGASHFEK